MSAPYIGAETSVIATFFPDFAAATTSEEDLILQTLADRIAATTASKKATLPWLKLGRFGDLRSDKNSLRHNANVLTITGIEADYDDETISFEEAREILRAAGTAAILYTSPSHTEDAPRWRVLAPLSAEYPPERRDQFMGRLNGLFGGIFAGESWTLSQSYYFGSVNRSLSHRVALIPGRPIDLMDELDAGAIGKPGARTADGSERPDSHGAAHIPVADMRVEGFIDAVLGTLRRDAVDGGKHFALLRIATTLGGIQATAGFTDADAWEWLKDCLPDTVDDWTAAEKTAIDGLQRGRAKPITLEDRPRPTSGSTSPFGIPRRGAEPRAADAPSEEPEIDSGDDPDPSPSDAPPRPDEDGEPRPDRDAKDEPSHHHDAEPPPSDDPPPPGGDGGRAQDEKASQSEQDTKGEQPHHAGRNRRRSAEPREFVWPAPVDFLADPNGEAPVLRPEHIPEAINDFVFDTAERMGVDSASAALACIVSLASVATDDWKIQPKRHDHTWTENPRLWGAILGPPSVLKSPVISACTKPIDKLDAAARRRHAEAMRTYMQQLKVAKADKSGATPEPTHPKLDRYLVENTTTEVLSEILREDHDARQRAPAHKVMSRHDEMSEFFANLDRYRPGGNGGGDRGAYLRLYNGGPYSIDRIGRGSFAVPNWSACFLGGMQPGPIQNIAKNAAEDGLLQRFLYAVPGPQAAGVDRKPSAAAQDRYNGLFPVLAALGPPRTMDGHHIQAAVFHADAHQHREAVDRRAEIMALMPDTSGQLLSAYGKWPGLFARIALTFHLIELADASAQGRIGPYPVVISEPTARRAAAFMVDIALPHLLRAHRLMFSTTQTGHAQWIAGYILTERLERITTRDVVRAYRALKAPEAQKELEAVMASLVTVGWMEPEIPTNAVRPVNAWAVNPAVHVRFADRAEREQARRDKAKEDLTAYFEALRRGQAENP